MCNIKNLIKKYLIWSKNYKKCLQSDKVLETL